MDTLPTLSTALTFRVKCLGGIPYIFVAGYSGLEIHSCIPGIAPLFSLKIPKATSIYVLLLLHQVK